MDTMPLLPGNPVPHDGLYECDCGRKHHFRAPDTGNPLPPLAFDCLGTCWHPISPTGTTTQSSDITATADAG
jgi:hypothetical protein